MKSIHSNNLRWFSKIIVFATLFLIFAGALVKSFEVGLSVPDWPTTYGYQMFAFPWTDMVGGIFYEHGHRMLATVVGALTLVLAIWLGFRESRKSIKILGYTALALVIIQGLLGGLTVLFFLPTIISLLHGVTAQTFLLILILITFSLSKEFSTHLFEKDFNRKYILWLLSVVYIQLIIGAWMRHTNSGLAIFDFPLTAGYWIPMFNNEMLTVINDWRFEVDLPDVSLFQVVIHFIHRCSGYVIFGLTGLLGYKFLKNKSSYSKRIINNIYLILILVLLQIILGAFTIWTLKGPYITSIHVVNGAAVMGATFLLLLRMSDLTLLKN